jgi:hypothetical protein
VFTITVVFCWNHFSRKTNETRLAMIKTEPCLLILIELFGKRTNKNEFTVFEFTSCFNWSSISEMHQFLQKSLYVKKHFNLLRY